MKSECQRGTNERRNDRHRSPRTLPRHAVTALVAALVAIPTAAAEEEADEEPLIEEMVVTATYRDTRLMDTPITISALTDVDIVQKGIQDIHTLYTSIPGFNYKSSTLAFNILSIRGITPFAGGPSPVGAYLNNMPIGSTRGDSGHFRLGLFDLERVEVLKGPQGTLYGEGAMGGAIRYITKQPDTSGFDYSFRGSFEDMAHSGGLGHRIDGMLNVPLGDRAAVRLVAYSRDQKGLIDVPGLRNEDDVNWTEELGGRITFALDATETLRLTAMANIVDTDMGGPGIAFHCYEEVRQDIGINEVPDYPSPGVDCTGDHNAQFARDPYITHKTHPDIRGLDGNTDDYAMYNIGAEWELPFADLIGSWSYIDRTWRGGNEEAPPHVAFLKGLVEGANCFGALPEGVCGVPGTYSSQSAYGLVLTWSERLAYEMRLVSNNTDSAFQWTIGAYVKDDQLDRGDHSPCPSSVPYASVAPEEHCFLQWLFHPDTPVDHQAMIANWLNTAIFAGNRSVEWTEDQSYFGEASYRITDQWEVTVGARYAHVQVRVDTLEAGVNPTNAVLNTFTLDDDKKTSPKVTLTWRPKDDLMIYGTWSHGFRPGVVQSRLVAIIAQLDTIRANNAEAEELYRDLVDAQTVNGDEAESYEIGVKATVADGRLSFTGALYRIDWTDIIVRTSAQTPAIQGLVPFPLSYDDNAGSAQSEGLELELQAKLSDTVRFALGGAYMWTADIGTASTGNIQRVSGNTVDVVPGNRIPASPEVSGYASLAYDFQLAGYNATARVDGYLVTEQFRGGNNERATPGYQTVDVKLLTRRDKYEFAFYVRNLFDEVVAYERNQQGYVFGRARTMGLEFNYNL